jgi:hypothetical protein
MTPFRRFVFSSLMATLLIVGVPVSVSAQLGTPAYTFSAGTVIRSADVNSLFSTIYSNACNRTGCVLTGTMTTLALLPTTDNASDIGSAALSYKDAWFDGTVTIASLVVATITPTTITCTGCIGATQLAATSVSAASYGGANSIATFTVDADGRLTAAGTATPQIPIASGVTGLGTGVATALAVNVGSAGAPVLFDGAGGTPSALVLTNATGLPAASVLAGTFGTGAYTFDTGVVSTVTTGSVFTRSGASTNGFYVRMANTGGDSFFGVENSAGNAIINGTAYATYVYANGTTPIQLANSTGILATFNGTGTTLAGLLTVSGGITNDGKLIQATSSTVSNPGDSGYNSTNGTYVYSKAGTGGDFVLYNADGYQSILVSVDSDLQLYSRNTLALTLGVSQAATFTGAITVSSTSTAAVNIAGALNVGGQSSSIAAGDISAARSATSGYINMGTDGGVYFGRTAGAVVLGGASFAWGSGSAITSSDSVALLAGATFTGAITAPASSSFTTDLKVLGAEAGAATLYLWADEGDDAADKFSLVSNTSNTFQLMGSNGSYDHLTITDLGSNGGTQLEVGDVSGARQVKIVSAVTSGSDILTGYINVPGGSPLAGTASGAYIYLNSTPGGAGRPGFLAVETSGGTAYSIFADTAGDARIFAGTAPLDGSGTVIGTQTSTLATKVLTHRDISPTAALTTILGTEVRSFTYKSGSYSNTEFQGIIADWSPAFAMDRGQSFNPVSAFGYTVQAFKAQQAQIDALAAELAILKGHRQ